jgi:heme/copper-type cytochrome/quinol oxidase subunit 4
MVERSSKTLMIKQVIGAALGLMLTAVPFLLLIPRGNEWGQLNQPRRSPAKTVSVR